MSQDKGIKTVRDLNGNMDTEAKYIVLCIMTTGEPIVYSPK